MDPYKILEVFYFLGGNMDELNNFLRSNIIIKIDDSVLIDSNSYFGIYALNGNSMFINKANMNNEIFYE